MSYKPLGMAVFLVLGGLLFGALVIPKTGVIKKEVTLGGSTFIQEVHGAEIDSAALTVQDAPFLASENAGGTQTGTVSSSQDLGVFYLDGAVSDPIAR